MRVRSFAISVCAVAAMTAGLFARGGSRPADWVRIVTSQQSPDSTAVEAPQVPQPEIPDTLITETDTVTVAEQSEVPQTTERPRMRRRTEPAPGADTAVIFMKADWVTRRQIDTARVTCFVGNFAAHHNGTIITADSAIRYSDSYVECFGNVLINKNTTYVYGDRADYDSEMEIANVYAPIVKMVDGDATLYSYNFSFDTRDNIGTFYGGGMVINRENRLESDRGYYYADYHDVVCVERVEVDTETYEMKGDSVIYNVDTDNAYYFDHSNIWNDKGEYLYADRGEYRSEGELYKVTANGYILTEKQEVWSDSIDYFRGAEHAVLRRNIQIDDTEHMTLGFGDYGEYWGADERAFLTVRPSVVNYDTSQGDTLYMRSDSMFLYTIRVLPDGTEKLLGEPEQAESAVDSLAGGMAVEIPDADGETPAAEVGRRPERMERSDMDAAAGRGELPERGRRPKSDMLSEDSAAGVMSGHPADSLGGGVVMADSLIMGADSLASDSLALDSLRRELTPEELKAKRREEAERIKAEKKAAAAKARKERLDRIAATRLAKLQKQKAKDEAAAAVRREKAEARRLKALERENAKRAKKGLPPLGDSVAQARLALADSLARMAAADSLRVLADSLARMAAETLSADTLAVDTVRVETSYKRIQCYRDVRIYRTDFQALCDSLVAFSSDSTAHLYIRPVLWNGNNQVTSEVMDIFTAKQMITRADFVGRPMMIAELDTMCYNQVSGKTMTASFDENGQIYRNDVNGNVETVYYIQDSSTGEITDAMYLTSGDATYYITDKQVETITYRTSADGQLSPVNMIPEDQTTRLQGFEWRGAERPDRDAVFDRRIRPSQRERVESLQRPRFPITRQMEAMKQRLISRGEWLDRVDVLSPEDEEWRRETLAAPYK